MENKNKILFDWLSFTTTISDERDIIHLLGMDDVPFEELNGIMGFNGFTKRLYFSGISIHYASKMENVKFIWLEMSGQGCRTFESLSSHKDYKLLFEYVLGNPCIDGEGVRITRLDVAYDDFNGLLDLNAIQRDVLPDVSDKKKHNYISKSRAYEILNTDRGACVTIGSKRSDILFRIYDKASERNRQDEIDHWVRCEIQIRRDRAHEFIRLLVEENEVIDDLYFAVLNHYVRFVKPSDSDTNKWRWELADHWKDFANSRENNKTVSLYVKPGMDYNLEKLQHYVTDMAGAAIYTYMKINGINELFDECAQKHLQKLNPKYQRLLSEYDEFMNSSLDELYAELHADDDTELACNKNRVGWVDYV